MSLVVDGLSKHYSKSVHALDNISFRVNAGECIGIVGESGSGKSTLARVLLGLESYKDGRITINGKPIAPKKRALLREYRKSVQMIFQDATSTLNPKLPIWKSILEPLDNFKEITPSFLQAEGLSRKEVAEELLEIVGLEKQMVDRYPGELSGGQKQRVSIARALSIEPTLLVCDEPTASLDVTVQVQILRLLKDLQKKTNMTILFISHDIRAVTFLCEKVIVLKNGSIVDQFGLEGIYHKERHPYTKALIKAASIE
ncbi:ABC transporter ATP-binding protein [Halalkalibacter lacteus]|uniref:ABC transporter ATP-binding protein n=1 Tax=Halalkalibacter lacteus TaxID=3090663 RepID=UPI002FCAD3AD